MREKQGKRQREPQREEEGERMMSRRLQSGEASGIFQLVEQINNIIVWLKSIKMVRSRESFNEKSHGPGIWNPG